jgi:hypothetical protein
VREVLVRGVKGGERRERRHMDECDESGEVLGRVEKSEMDRWDD